MIQHLCRYNPSHVSTGAWASVPSKPAPVQMCLSLTGSEDQIIKARAMMDQELALEVIREMRWGHTSRTATGCLRPAIISKSSGGSVYAVKAQCSSLTMSLP